jgi:integrase
VQGFPARTASFPSKRMAERWAKTIEAEMIEGRHFRNVEARRRTVADAIDRYLEEEVPKKRSGKVHKFTLPWWREAIGELKLSEVTPAVLSEQLGKLGRQTFGRAKPESKRTTLQPGETPRQFKRSGGTVNRYRGVMSHVFTTARREWHWINHNPFESVSKAREGVGRVRHLSAEERTALFTETLKQPTLHLLVLLALSTAARAGELLQLTWRDVDLSKGRLLFRVTKNAQPRVVWIQGEALQRLDDHSKVRHVKSELVFWNPSGKGKFDYSKAFKAACAASGVTDFRFHDLRHSAATYLAMAGATEQQLRAIGGWKSGVVSRYVHLAANDAKDVMAKMNREILGDKH